MLPACTIKLGITLRNGDSMIVLILIEQTIIYDRRQRSPTSLHDFALHKTTAFSCNGSVAIVILCHSITGLPIANESQDQQYVTLFDKDIIIICTVFGIWNVIKLQTPVHITLRSCLLLFRLFLCWIIFTTL